MGDIADYYIDQDIDMGACFAQGKDNNRVRRLTCPYCKAPVIFDSATAVYGPAGSEWGDLYICSRYPACDAYVGVHRGTKVPKGSLANKELRTLRMAAHKAFDASWRHKHHGRSRAYGALAKAMDIRPDQAHIGMFTVEQCRRVISLYARTPTGVPMPIPTATPKLVTDLARQLILIHAGVKVGKTTLAAEFPGSIFLATEAGLGATTAMRWVRDAALPADDASNYVIRSWEELLAAAREIVAGKAHKTIIIDTIGNACALADQHICKKAGVDFRADGVLGYGKGAAQIIGEIKRFLTGLSGTGIGLVLIAHSTTKTITTPAGEVVKTVPHIPGDNKTSDIYTSIMGMADLILFIDSAADGKRVIRTKPSMAFDAGDRSGRMPPALDCSYAALAAAFAPRAPAAAAASKP